MSIGRATNSSQRPSGTQGAGKVPSHARCVIRRFCFIRLFSDPGRRLAPRRDKLAVPLSKILLQIAVPPWAPLAGQRLRHNDGHDYRLLTTNNTKALWAFLR